MSSSNLLRRSFASKDRVGKSRSMKRSFSDKEKRRILEKLNSPVSPRVEEISSPPLTSGIVKLAVGPSHPPRMFAAHEDVLAHSPYFAAVLRDLAFVQPSSRVVHLPDETPETFSCILEYLYKGDYFPRLIQNDRNEWSLEAPQQQGGHRKADGRATAGTESTIYHPGVGEAILRDTLVYCSAGRYGLDALQRLALRKQGLQEYVEIATILRSARFAYDNTPGTDSRLRAHYLAMIIRCRNKFKHSGTMQLEMEAGGKLYFDLFVAMCNHMDDLVDVNAQLTAALQGSPKGSSLRSPRGNPWKSPMTI